MEKGMLVVGSINLDLVVSAPHIPHPGENFCGGEFHMVPGGKGANQAVASSRLGNETVLLGSVGRDLFGDFLVGRLAENAVDTSLVKRATGKTGVALIVVEESTGDNTVVVAPGANRQLEVDDLAVLDPHFGRFSCALFQLEIQLEVVSAGAQRAREHGLLTVLDAGPPRGADLSLLQQFDVVSPNRFELAELTGRSVDNVTEAAEAAAGLVSAGGPVVVAKGAEG